MMSLIIQMDFIIMQLMNIQEAELLSHVELVVLQETMHWKRKEQAKAEGMVGLKGHRLVGHIRASMFNGMEIEEAEKFQTSKIKTKNAFCKCILFL